MEHYESSDTNIMMRRGPVVRKLCEGRNRETKALEKQISQFLWGEGGLARGTLP